MPSFDFVHVWDACESRAGIFTNALGMRGRELPLTKRAGGFRIVMLGDSYTFGYGVGEEETSSALLEYEFTGVESVDARQAVVVNDGVPGYCTAHEIVQFETLGWSLLADVVVSNFLY